MSHTCESVAVIGSHVAYSKCEHEIHLDIYKCVLSHMNAARESRYIYQSVAAVGSHVAYSKCGRKILLNTYKRVMSHINEAHESRYIYKSVAAVRSHVTYSKVWTRDPPGHMQMNRVPYVIKRRCNNESWHIHQV